MIYFCQWFGTEDGVPVPASGKEESPEFISSEMNVSDLMINLCESQLTTLKNKKVVAFQKYTAAREKKSKLGWWLGSHMTWASEMSSIRG